MAHAKQKRKGTALHTRILIGLIIGAVLGLLCNAYFGGQDAQLVWVVSNVTEPVGKLFLNLLLMIVVPLVFASVIVGVTGMGDIRTLGRVGLKSFLYTVVVSGISVVIGIGLTNLLEPGNHVNRDTSTALIKKFSNNSNASTVTESNSDSVAMQVVKTIVPSNPFAAAASPTPNMLHLMFFALFLGIAMTLLKEGEILPVRDFFESTFLICARCIDIVMEFAPFAVACLIFNNTAIFGLDLLQALMWFIFTVLLGLALQMFGVYSLSVYFLSKMSPIAFFKNSRLAIVTAFSTSSSNATLPTALKVSEENLGVPKDISKFVLTVGATANQNGTALYEGVTILFLAQLAGIDLTLSQQFIVAYMAILGGIGTAGVPSGSIPFIALVLAMLGIDPTLAGIILGVDRVLDMCRTTLNVVGDLTIATYVAESERARGQIKAA